MITVAANRRRSFADLLYERSGIRGFIAANKQGFSISCGEGLAGPRLAGLKEDGCTLWRRVGRCNGRCLVVFSSEVDLVDLRNIVCDLTFAIENFSTIFPRALPKTVKYVSPSECSFVKTKGIILRVA